MDKNSMVVTEKISQVLSLLEKYFLINGDYQLRGESYDMIMVTPEQSNIERNSWVVSAKQFDAYNSKDKILDILTYLQTNLDSMTYVSVSTLNVIDSNNPFVKNIKFIFPFNHPVYEINNFLVGGIEISHAYLIKSTKLEKLLFQKQVYVNHRTYGSILVTPIRLDRYWNLEYYTEAGIAHINSHLDNLINRDQYYQSKRQEWIERGFIKTILYDDIVAVY